ncbi:MAG: hypothetical protein A4E71_01942 [Smithella sp. PtaU1.Bin162]|nr:MAG: hypothetical protein A4E71_01942 [Smithella sp. PtaU1.Bin162]
MPVKPTEQEEEYFARQEYERKRKQEEKNHKLMQQAEKDRRQKLHYMRCPKCGMELIEINYKNTKIDKCSECHGIWMDQGELEQITHMEKSVLDKFFGVFKD